MLKATNFDSLDFLRRIKKNIITVFNNSWDTYNYICYDVLEDNFYRKNADEANKNISIENFLKREANKQNTVCVFWKIINGVNYDYDEKEQIRQYKISEFIEQCKVAVEDLEREKIKENKAQEKNKTQVEGIMTVVPKQKMIYKAFKVSWGTSEKVYEVLKNFGCISVVFSSGEIFGNSLMWYIDNSNKGKNIVNDIFDKYLVYGAKKRKDENGNEKDKVTEFAFLSEKDFKNMYEVLKRE